MEIFIGLNGKFHIAQAMEVILKFCILLRKFNIVRFYVVECKGGICRSMRNHFFFNNFSL